MVFQIEHLFRQFCSKGVGAKILDLSILCEHDNAELWSWNQLQPRENQACVSDLFSQQVMHNTDYLAIYAWDGKLTYLELDVQSIQLARWLVETSVAVKGRIISVCFDKAKWTTIAILAIAKSGSIFCLLGPDQPRACLAAIMLKIQGKYFLAGPDTFDVAVSICDTVIIVDENLIRHPHIGTISSES